MLKDKVWLVSVIVCFVSSVVLLAGKAIGMSDALVRVFGVIDLASVATVAYRTVKGKKN